MDVHHYPIIVRCRVFQQASLQGWGVAALGSVLLGGEHVTLLRSAYNAAARHGVHALNTQPVVGNTLASVNLRREAGLDTRTWTQVCYKVNQNSLTRARRAEHRQLGLRLAPHGWCAWSLRRVQQPGTSRYRRQKKWCSHGSH